MTKAIKNPTGNANSRAARQEVYIDFQNFTLGLWSLQDTTKAPFGSARIMTNMQITDRGGLAPRPGTKLLGTKNTSTMPTRGLYNFRKSFDQNELLIKTYDDKMEVYSKNDSDLGWFLLKDSFTSDKEFGFVNSLVNTENTDMVVFCNRYEPYQRWLGSVATLDGALSGGETSVVVDSLLTNEVYESHESSDVASSSSTTLQLSTTPWANDQWNGTMYVRITSGTYNGYISLISDTTDDTITFAELPGDPGTCSFEIRMSAFPATGTLIVGGTTVDYSSIPKDDTFTVASAPTADDGVAVAIVPDEYPLNPRGNRMTNYLGRIVVGNVRSAAAPIGSGGALQGYSAGGSYFVSKINDPLDFSFSATRVAGEGDLVGTPYGGGEITDVQAQESQVYVFKPRYIEACEYSQDANDYATRTPLKAQVGAKVPTIKGSDDTYFVTDDNQITSIGRTLATDTVPQTTNLGYKIKRTLDNMVFDFGHGIEYKNFLFIPAKSSSDAEQNDTLIVYSLETQSFWGLWDIPANFLEQFNNTLLYGDALGPNIYEMFVGTSDVDGDDRYPISAEYASHFMNLLSSNGNVQALNGMYYEGYISGDTVITFNVWKDFDTSPFLQFNFSGTEDVFQSGNPLNAFMGGDPIGLHPMGALSEPDADGRRHFFFRIYFPFQYGYHFSVGFSSVGTDFDYEVTRMGLLLKSTVSNDATKIKVISN